MTHADRPEQQEIAVEEIATTIVADAPDAILYADRKGVIWYWNGGCERIFGFSAKEAIGQSLDIIIPESLGERHWRGYTEAMRTGQSRYGKGDLLSVPALRKGGTRISVEFSIVPFRGPAGIVRGMTAIMRDVTQRFEEMKALRKQAAAGGST
jgi:PAS domain S-box-containing protein